MATDTICARLFAQGRTRPEAPAYHVWDDGRWAATGYGAYAGEVRQAAKALVALGFEPGDKTCILGFNRPEWVILDVATMCAGGAPAGIYTTCSAEEVRYVVWHSESRIVLVEDADQWRKLFAQRHAMPALETVVMMRGAEAASEIGEAAEDGGPYRGKEGFETLTWEAFLAKGEGVADAEIDRRVEALEPDGLATLIYTSGTTGPPKGVMLSHRNLAWTADAAIGLVALEAGDRSLSYLPLSHIAEQMFSIHGPITSGGAIYFARSIEKVPEDLRSVQPQVFFGVPRIWEKLHAGISTKLAGATGIKKALAQWAMRTGRAAWAERSAGRQPAGLLALQHRLADKLIYRKVKEAVGLGAARVCVSGAAPIAKEVLEFFTGLDVLVLEVYGQSEDTGPTTFNQPRRFRLGTVGPAIPGVEVRIAEDGEIQVRGPNVFLGYYKDEAATAETLVDGWLCSGDLGAFDADGFLSITGRKKEIIITAGGKNVAPKNIEASLKNHPLVNEAVVIGDRRKYLTALLTLDPEASQRFADARGLEVGKLHEAPETLAEIQKAVDEANTHLARVEQVKKFRVLHRNLSVEEGELTPTLKVKRKAVAERFAGEIEAMYAE